jgi:3-methylcrotonyl-CoA carboxylase alpha subunit
MAMIRKLLIANRGEIAIRIARTCRHLGIPVAGVHSTADRDSLHVRTLGESYEIGEAAPSKSYLNIDAILKAAREAGADAIHPGIGFLAEAPEFAAAVEDAGLIFVGPRARSLADFGDKAMSKRFAIAAGVPIIEGTEQPSADANSLVDAAKAMTLPLMLKAVAGGGGRGSRIVHNYDGLKDAVESAMREAQSAFGKPDLIIESFIASARHVEVQVVGDGNGQVIHLFERECSLQRRFQKIIEEAPAQHLTAAMRERITADAVRLASEVKYRSAGTFEFLVSGDRHYFLECNPRLQVEHTVTEEITGTDIVQLQLAVAADGALPISQSDITTRGHAVQARLYAEDPAQDFLPSTGRILAFDAPAAHVRTETGVETGSEITPHYDSLLAKLIVHAPDRVSALGRLRSALKDMRVLGVETNLDLLAHLCGDARVISDDVDNRYIDRELPQMQLGLKPDPTLAAIAGAIELHQTLPAADGGPWRSPDLASFRLPSDAEDSTRWLGALRLESQGESYSLHRAGAGRNRYAIGVDGQTFHVSLDPRDGDRYFVTIGGKTLLAQVASADGQMYLATPGGSLTFHVVHALDKEERSAVADGRVTSNMMGVIIKVNVAPGDRVAEGDTIMVQESMKMELTIAAPCTGVVTGVLCGQGDLIERNAVVAEIEPERAEAAA